MPKLRIVGAGTPTWTPDRWGTCFVLEICGQRLMIDCGPASTYKMYRMGIPCTSINDLFFTHLHSDHVSDYLCFLMTRFDQCVGTEPDLRVHGPPPIREITGAIWSEDKGVFWYDVLARTNHPMSVHAFHMRGGSGERPAPVVEVGEYGEGRVADGEGWTCHARQVRHAQPWIECFGFRFETDEGVVAFSGDTAPADAVVELARGADLFVMEAVAPGGEDPHLSERGLRDGHPERRPQWPPKPGQRGLVINHQAVTLETPGRDHPGDSRGAGSLRRSPLLGAGPDGRGMVRLPGAHSPQSHRTGMSQGPPPLPGKPSAPRSRSAASSSP